MGKRAWRNRIRLYYLDKDVSGEIFAVLRATIIAVFLLHSLSPAEEIMEHLFILTGEQPIYHSSRRMAPQHNDVLGKEIDVILKAGIVTPETSV